MLMSWLYIRFRTTDLPRVRYAELFLTALSIYRLVMVFHCARKSERHLRARLYKATGSNDVVRSAFILLHVELTIHNVLVVLRQLEVEHLSLLDECARVKSMCPTQGSCEASSARIGIQAT